MRPQCNQASVELAPIIQIAYQGHILKRGDVGYCYIAQFESFLCIGATEVLQLGGVASRLATAIYVAMVTLIYMTILIIQMTQISNVSYGSYG